MLRVKLFKVLSVLALSLASSGAFAEVITLKVTAAGFKYSFNGQPTPTVNVAVGDTVVFDLSDSSLNSHPFYLTENADSGRSYSNVVSDAAAKTLVLDITSATPTALFYSCTRHSRMGGTGSIQVAAPLPALDETTALEGNELTLKVTAASGRYSFDGVVTPVVTVKVGDTLVFDLSDSSLSSHPFYLTEQADSGRKLSSALSDSSTSSLVLKITEETPKELFYSCTRHRNMGGTGFIQVLVEDAAN